MSPTRNRLSEASSPYLQQHADNPVAWQQWGEQAFAEARERDVPVFLSIGYSACHWCHVMAEESFEDEATAGIVNESFVPVKVDREERPDLDSIYQTICQLVTGSGGWPLSVWLTPDGKPFYVGTYFPPEPRYNRPAFSDLCQNIAESWNRPGDRAEMEQRAEQWTSAIEGEVEEVPDQPGDAPDDAFVIDAANAALRAADREYGGFGTGQKFPQGGRLHLLLRAAVEGDRPAYGQVVGETLEAMANGGLYDHLGGGFHRYTVDRKWVVPHFEKMLYDQAEITRAMLAGYQKFGVPRYATVAEETLGFVTRELQHPDGGFYSTLDAQSGGEEGSYYVWTPEDVEAAVEDDLDVRLFCEYFGITEDGNFEDDQTVVTISSDLETLAEAHDIDTEEVSDRLDRAVEQAATAREERERPPRDEKVLAGWNGLMISAFAEGALVLDPSFADPAREALGFCRDVLWDESTAHLSRRFKDGDVDVDGYLEDYAFLARGALATYEATGEVEHLAFSLELASAIEELFWDAEEGTLYFTPHDGESLIARPQELTDQSTPSSLGVACSVFLTLDQFVPHDRFRELTETVLSTHANRVRSNPLQYASVALAGDEAARGHIEVTIAADHWPVEPEGWRTALAETYLPRRVLAPRPPTDDGLDEWLDILELDTAPPIWNDRSARDGPTVYLCEEFTCSPPQSSMAAALAWRE